MQDKCCAFAVGFCLQIAVSLSGSFDVYFRSIIKRSNLHLGESQRVVISSPVTPRDSVSIGRRYASQVGAVQVRGVTFFVPPSTFVRHCTRA